jgi:hypothetical protein
MVTIVFFETRSRFALYISYDTLYVRTVCLYRLIQNYLGAEDYIMYAVYIYTIIYVKDGPVYWSWS